MNEEVYQKLRKDSQVPESFDRLTAAFDRMMKAAKLADEVEYCAAVAAFDRAQRAAGGVASRIYCEAKKN